MRIDFYHLTRTSIDRALPQIVDKIWAQGLAAVIVAEGDHLRTELEEALWTWKADSFIPHGQEGDQPVLLVSELDGHDRPYRVHADGIWRAPEGSSERIFHFFNDEMIEAARAAWREVAATDAERHYWKQAEGGRWVEGP